MTWERIEQKDFLEEKEIQDISGGETWMKDCNVCVEMK